MLRGVQCRLYPTAEQRAFFARSFGCVRFVYNEALAHCQSEREAQRKHPLRRWQRQPWQSHWQPRQW